jgi:peptide chain release factor
MKKMMIQITAGKGPAECCRVVACMQSLMMKQARQQSIELQVLENKAGELNGTLLSATMMATGNNLDAFVKDWAGTIQW